MLPVTVPDRVAVRLTLFNGAMPEAGDVVRLTERVGSELTVRVNVVVRVRVVPVPVMVIVYVPMGVVAVVVMALVVVQVGVHDMGANEAVAPVGRPDAV